MKTGRNTAYDPEAINFAKSIFALVDSPAQKHSRAVRTRNAETLDEIAARSGTTPEQLRESIARVRREVMQKRHQSIVQTLAGIAAKGDAEASRFFLKLGKLIAKGEYREPDPDTVMFHVYQFVTNNNPSKATELAAYLYRQGIPVSESTALRLMKDLGVKPRRGRP